MESEEYGDDSKAERSREAIRFACIALLKTDWLRWNVRKSRVSYQSLVPGVMCSIVYLLTRTAVTKLSAMFLARE